MNSTKLFRKIKIDFQFLCLNPKMPKMKKSSSEQVQKNNSGQKQMKAVEENGAIYNGTKGEIILRIHAKPSAKESGITDISNEAVGVQISAPPVDGEANKELIRYLAEVLSIKKSELSFKKVSRSREKTVVISGTSITLDTVKSKILEAIKQQE